MGIIKSRHDKLIRAFLNDSRYTVNTLGFVFKNGKKIGFTRDSEANKRGTRYRYIRYKGKDLKIHRIVSQKFYGNLNSEMVIHHKNGNSLDNRYTNLSQVTQQQNEFYKRYKFIKCED